MKHGAEIPRNKFFNYFRIKNNRLIASGLQRIFPKLPKLPSTGVPKGCFNCCLCLVFVFEEGRSVALLEGIVGIAVTLLGIEPQGTKDVLPAGVERAGEGTLE